MSNSRFVATPHSLSRNRSGWHRVQGRMRRRRMTRVAGVGVAVAAGTASLSIAVNGLATASLPGPAGDVLRHVLPPAETATAAELSAFKNCNELRRWYVRAALPQVGPW